MNKSSQNIAISLKNVSKSFKLPHEHHNSIKSIFTNGLSFRTSYEKQVVIDDISFDIKKGEFFGIVGRNGSGKSTLLKILSGIYKEDNGQVAINGKLTPFIELGVGFSPELSGRENVYLNGSLLGFSRKEMDVMYDDIVSFAELEQYMDQKLKNYSSGMQVRLAFSIAIRADTDILVLDEVLAVGDSAFQQKCYDYFATLKKGGKTVILVSHSMAAVERFCTRALLLEKGKVAGIGNSSDIALMYEKLFMEDSGNNENDNSSSNKDLIKPKLSIIYNNKSVSSVLVGEYFELLIEFSSSINIDELNIGINIRDNEDRIVYSTDMRLHINTIKVRQNDKVSVGFGLDNYFTNGRYTVDAFFVDEKGVSGKLISKTKSIGSFKVVGVKHHEHSMFHPPVKVKVYENK